MKRKHKLTIKIKADSWIDVKLALQQIVAFAADQWSDGNILIDNSGCKSFSWIVKHDKNKNVIRDTDTDDNLDLIKRLKSKGYKFGKVEKVRSKPDDRNII